MNARLPVLALVATMLFGVGLLWRTGDSLPLVRFRRRAC